VQAFGVRADSEGLHLTAEGTGIILRP